jgi:hypothetical protein
MAEYDITLDKKRHITPFINVRSYNNYQFLIDPTVYIKKQRNGRAMLISPDAEKYIMLEQPEAAFWCELTTSQDFGVAIDRYLSKFEDLSIGTARLDQLIKALQECYAIRGGSND